MKLFISAYLLCSPLIFYGQDSAFSNNRLPIVIYTGVHTIFTPGLDARLKGIGFNKPLSVFLSLGLGMNYETGNDNYGVDFKLGLLNYPSSTFSYSSYYGLYYHKKIVDNDKIMIAPGLNLGYQSMNMNCEKPNSAGSLYELFHASGNYVRLNNRSVTSGIATTIYLKQFSRSKNVFYRCISRMKAGYNFGLTANAWTADGNDIPDAPEDRLSNFYFQLILMN